MHLSAFIEKYGQNYFKIKLNIDVWQAVEVIYECTVLKLHDISDRQNISLCVGREGQTDRQTDG